MKLDYFPYQVEGAKAILAGGRHGLHDEMGIGKTATVLCALDELHATQGSARGIVVCPAMLRHNWMLEAAKFQRAPLKWVKGHTVHDFAAWKRGRFDVIVTSYEMSVKWAKAVAAEQEILDFIAFDEAHYLKNWKAARTKAAFGVGCNGKNALSSLAAHVWHVTGTPMSNCPQDLYPFFRMVGATDLSPFAWLSKHFTRVEGPFGAKFMPDASSVPLFRDLLEKHSIARTHSDVELQLPPIHLPELVVEGDTTEIKALLKATPGLEDAILDAITAGGLSRIEAPAMPTLRRLVGTAKAVPYARLLTDELAGGGKRVVFAVHKRPIEIVSCALRDAGIGYVVVTGDTSEPDRIAAVHNFQNDPKVQVFIGNIRAAGTGLTLTAAAELDMLEADWTPAGNAQAIKRVLRLGQKANRVRARFVTLASSIDERVNHAVAAKVRAIVAISDREMVATPGV